MKTPYELFYIECDKGWEKLYQPLIDYCKEHNITIFQIKEKYGELRFYVDSATDEEYNMIDKASKESLKTCEICGEPGKLRVRHGYWYKTVCDSHAKEHNYEDINYSNQSHY